MPVERGVDKKGHFYRFGVRGFKYYYVPGNETSRKGAKMRAATQGRAIKRSQTVRSYKRIN